MTSKTYTLSFAAGMAMETQMAKKADEFHSNLVYGQIKRTPRNLAKCREMLLATGVYDEVDADVMMQMIDCVAAK